MIYNKKYICFQLVSFSLLFFRIECVIKGAVVCGGCECAQIGKSVLEKNGSAVDAAIATLFCEGVSMPQSMGLGGGFLMTIYQFKKGKAFFLNAREAAPKAATVDLLGNHGNLERENPLSIAIPGELRGYWFAHLNFGKLPWEKLVYPTIQLCKKGILVSKCLAKVLRRFADFLKSNKILKEIFIDPATDEPYLEGQRFKMLRLVKTLRIIATEGGDALHDGRLTERFVNDLKDQGSIIEVEDLELYRPLWQYPIAINLPNNQELYTAPLPGGGVLLTFILNILNDYLDVKHPECPRNFQRIVEAFKFAYGHRTRLGDSDFVPHITEIVANLTSVKYANFIRKFISDVSTSQDPFYYTSQGVNAPNYGTAHVSVLAPNGDAVSVTSTINYFFGSGIVSPSTGILLNNEMDDFSSPGIQSAYYHLPPSTANYIQPEKRPFSSMAPSIVVDKQSKRVRMIIGGAGGCRITTSMALVMINHLFYGWDIKKSICEKRFHHQLYPMSVEFELTYQSDPIVEYFCKKGHNYKFYDTMGFAAVSAITVDKDGNIKGATDPRRSGEVAYLQVPDNGCCSKQCNNC